MVPAAQFPSPPTVSMRQHLDSAGLPGACVRPSTPSRNTVETGMIKEGHFSNKLPGNVRYEASVNERKSNLLAGDAADDAIKRKSNNSIFAGSITPRSTIRYRSAIFCIVQRQLHIVVEDCPRNLRQRNKRNRPPVTVRSCEQVRHCCGRPSLV